MPSFKDILSVVAFASFTILTRASPTESSLPQDLATALGVTVKDITTLQTAGDVSVDVERWANPLGLGSGDVAAWDDDTKATFAQEIKSAIDEALGAPTVSKREKGSDSPAAKAQVKAAIAKAKADRDTSNRRKLLQCNSGSKASCTICAAICSTAWVSATALCGGAALGAEAASAGGLTPAVALVLSGCLGVAASGYAACIVKCIG